jgi:hypothetical protein
MFFSWVFDYKRNKGNNVGLYIEKREVASGLLVSKPPGMV